MRVRGLANSAFWAGILVQLALCHWAITPAAGDEPPTAASGNGAVVQSVVLGFEGDARNDKDDALPVRKALGETRNTFYSVMRGQEPDEKFQAQETLGFSFAPESLNSTGHGHEGCACHAHGIYPTAGTKRGPVSLFEIDSAQPVSVFRFRFDSAYDLENPDRAEYFWAKTVDGKGPKLAERSVDYQDINFYSETAMAEGALAAFTEIPIRVLEPSVNDNTTGLADITVGLKTVMLEDDDCQVTMIMKTFIPSGLDRRGLGTGHTSLEPGVLGRWQLDEQTWLHGEFKFWFPIAGDADHSGEVLRYGVGVSHVLCEWNTDSVSCYKGFIGTLELIGWSVVDGRETLPDGRVVSVDPAGILNIQPGLRCVWGKNKDFGISSSISLTSEHWYDQLVRVEFRRFF